MPTSAFPQDRATAADARCRQLRRQVLMVVLRRTWPVRLSRTSITSRSTAGSSGSCRCWPRPPAPAATRSVTAGRSTRPMSRSLAGGGYVSRAVDQVIDVFVSPRRDTAATRRFFERAIGTTRVTPIEVTTDRAAAYPAVLDDLLPARWPRTDQYANNRIECDHGRLKARPRPMRGLKQDHSARVITAGHAFVQNLGEDTTGWPLRSQ